MATKANQLQDLQVERVDGVDRPATGRKFILFKSEDASQSVMKGYALTATAAAEVLKAIRKGAASVNVDKSTAIALNGLAQVLGQEPLFKSVPTQPYAYSEPDVDKRGPADENLGSNFSPLSMVGKAELTLKAEAVAAAQETAKAEKDEDKKDEKDDMPPWMKKSIEAMSGAVAKAVEGIAAQVAKQGEQIDTIVKVAKGELGIEEKDEKAEPVRKSSRQVQADDEKQTVRKDAGLRMGVSFADHVFGGKR